uniref:SUN domain-containing protein n=1 Tax=Caenorhabditis tropicalis TaxID=1561998 RepID=A0A1I7TM78_9PELO
MPRISHGFSLKWFPSLRVSAVLILLFFGISSVFIYNSAFFDQSPSSANQPKDFLKKTEDINDYDASCSGYSISRIIREQTRILDSVRSELAESQVKIEEIRAEQEELQRLIPQKQLELSALEGEIEAAQRQLEELRETQNVKVFLPHSPLEIPTETSLPDTSASSSSWTLDEIFDLSRCSITSFMPVYVGAITSGQLEEEWEEVFREVALNLVEKPQEACLEIWITNGELRQNQTWNRLIFNIGDPIVKPQLAIIAQKSELRSFDYSIHANHTPVAKYEEQVPILPFIRENLICLTLRRAVPSYDLTSLQESAKQFTQKVIIKKCFEDDCSREEKERSIHLQYSVSYYPLKTFWKISLTLFNLDASLSFFPAHRFSHFKNSSIGV